MKKNTLIFSILLYSISLFAVNKTVGASGADYTTDGTSDEIEIQQAIDFVSSNGGGTVTLFDGTYNIQSVRITPKNNVILTGTSRNGTILASTRTYDYILGIFSGSLTSFQLKNMTINPQNADRASGVRFDLVNQVLVENVRFINANCGWHLILGINGNDAQNVEKYSRDNTVRNCLFDGHSGSLEMLLLFNIKNTLIENCIFKNKSRTACNVAGGRPTLGLWQKTDSISIKNCQFMDNESPETIYYSNTSNNTLIESCTFSNSGGIRGANESDHGTFGVAHGTGLIIKNCSFLGGANSVTQLAIQLGAIYNVLVKNCTITAYEEGIVFDNGNTLDGTNTNLNDRCQNFAVVNTNIYNCNPNNNVHDLHSGVLIQTIGGSMKGYWVCGSITDNQSSPTQRQAVSYYVYNTPNSPTYFNDMYFLGTNIKSYLGHPKQRFLNDATQGSPFVVEDCSGGSPPSYCSSCPNISDANAVAWINTSDPTTAAIVQNLMNYQTNDPILPVELLDFAGKAGKEGNRLTWAFADKTDLKNIEILKSSNGRDFTPLSILSKNESIFLDSQPFDLTYYRLKINELDSKSYFSKIISIKQQNTEGGKIKLFPNPVSHVLTIENWQGKDLEIVNTLGQVVMKKSGENAQNSANLTLTVSHIPNGIYFVRSKNTEGRDFVEKIVKQ